MKKITFIWIVLISVFAIEPVSAQNKQSELPLIIVIDNEFPIASIVSERFFVADSIKNVIDSMNCDYDVGRLKFEKLDFKRLFKARATSGNIFYLNFTWRNLKQEEELNYKIYFFPYEINEKYMIIKIFNADKEENQAKFIFKDRQKYVYDVISPGFMRFLPYRRKT
jgi:hypothetical protein